MPFADVNGQHLYFEDFGGDSAGDGAAVLFSHGFLMDHEMFEPQVAALSGEFRCITWDERGFGQSEATADFTYWDSADDALALLTHLGVERAFLVGMSQGGFLSMRAALRAPGRVLGLGLIDTQAGQEAEEARPVYDAMTEEWSTKGPSVEFADARPPLHPVRRRRDERGVLRRRARTHRRHACHGLRSGDRLRRAAQAGLLAGPAQHRRRVPRVAHRLHGTRPGRGA